MSGKQKTINERTGDQTGLYKLLIHKVMSAIHVSVPGVINSFDPGSQTASVTPTVMDTVQIGGEMQSVALPTLHDVPVAIPRGGDFAVTLPIRGGDACIIVFADSCIDGFMQSGDVSVQPEVRHHDLSDAMAIVGLAGEPIADYDPDKLEVRHINEDIKISLSKDEMELQYKESSIKLEEKKITLEADEVDVNGTIF